MEKPTTLYDPKTHTVSRVETSVRIYVRDPVDRGVILRDNSRDELFAWCRTNCQGRFWVGMGFGQFELEEDAMLFALRWK
jgi:hypothetical protein